MKAVNVLDKVILFSIFAIAFFLPISKAIIEGFSLLAAVCFIAKKIIQRRNIPKTHVNFAVFAYLIACFISVFISTNSAISVRTFFGKLMQNIALFFILADTLNTERRVKNLLYIFFLSSLLLGVDGIYQYFTGNDFIRNRLYREFGSRVSATFRSPSGFGCYLVAIISLLIPIFFIRLKFKQFKIILVAILILLTMCLVLTLSKGAWLAFFSSIIFLSFWLTAVRNIFLLLVLASLVLRLFFPAVLNNIVSSFASNLSNLSANAGIIHRKIMWHTGWSMFLSQPLVGVGLGTFMFNFQRFLTDDYKLGPAYAHNCYLQIAAETGVIGLLCFLGLLSMFFYHGTRILKTSARNSYWHILAGSLAALLGYCVQMGVDTTFYALDLGILFWIILGLGAALMRNIELQ